ncbi:MAG: hypothetical protein IPN33_17415 [Saprospiraceae bacterium]|nr:hypothetical protein [Saprospiraceae bacterium]
MAVEPGWHYLDEYFGATNTSYTTPSLTSTTRYRAVVSASGAGCGSATSNAAIVTVVADPSVTVQPVGATICDGGTHTMTVTATGGTPSLTYQWQSSPDGTTWTNISGATNTSYTTPSLTSTTRYRAVVSASGAGCGSATSNAAIVTVVADPSVTVQPVGTSICEGGTHTMTVTASGGTPSLTYQWQSSTDNVTFSNISGATNTTYTTPALSSTTYYRVVVSASGAGCGSATSATATVTVNPGLSISGQPLGATICDGGTHTMNITVTGGTPPVSYQWQSSSDNVTFTNISGATNTSYTTPTLTNTTYYRVQVTSSGGGCSAVTSAVATVTVVADPSVSVQPVGATICDGGTHTMTVTATGGTPSLTYQWQSSPDGTTWTNISGATNTSYTTPSLTSTTRYRVVVSASGAGCGSATSNAAIVTVVADPSVTVQPVGATICDGGTHTMTVTATGGTPSLTYQWQSSPDGTTWTNISGATNTTYTTPALTSTTRYRVVVSASGAGCGSATSNAAIVTVVADPSVTVQPVGATICDGGTHTMTVTATGGTPSLTYQWQSSPDGTTWTNISGATNTSYTTPSLTSTTRYRAVVSASGAGCGSATSNAAIVTVVADPSVTVQPVGATICDGGTHTMTVTATGGTPSLTYQWQSSPDGTTWTNISGATNTSYTTPSLTSTTRYRAVVSASGVACGSATSNAAIVTVVADPSVTVQPVGTSICEGGTHTMTVTATGGTPSLTYQWQSSTDNVTFSNISGATNTSYTTLALTSTTYYRVIVSASGAGCGSATSATATVTVNPGVSISGQPLGATICDGGTHYEYYGNRRHTAGKLPMAIEQ